MHTNLSEPSLPYVERTLSQRAIKGRLSTAFLSSGNNGNNGKTGRTDGTGKSVKSPTNKGEK